MMDCERTNGDYIVIDWPGGHGAGDRWNWTEMVGSQVANETLVDGTASGDLRVNVSVSNTGVLLQVADGKSEGEPADGSSVGGAAATSTWTS